MHRIHCQVKNRLCQIYFSDVYFFRSDVYLQVSIDTLIWKDMKIKIKMGELMR